MAPKRKHEIHDTPGAKRFKSNFDDTIAVLVGPDEVHFTLHKAIAAAKSPFFKAACSSNWPEGREDLVRLPEHCPRVFEVFIHWLYCEKMDYTAVRDPDSNNNPRYWPLAQIWTLGYYLQCFDMCNMVIDQFLERMRTRSLRSPATFLDQFPVGSSMRRLLVDHAVWKLNMELFLQRTDWPADLLRALSRSYLSGRKQADSNPLKRPPHYYYDRRENDASGQQN